MATHTYGETTMIKPDMAQKLIDQITGYTEYNINIMDGNGVIIASRDPGRIGTYHEAAGRILRSGTDVIEIEDDKMYPGALPGISTWRSRRTAEQRASWALPASPTASAKSP